MTDTPKRVFSRYDNESYKFRFIAELSLSTIVGGVPSDPKVAEGWLKSKLQETDDRIREMVAEVMVEREVGVEEATEIVNSLKNLNGFKRTPAGVLFIEGRQVKAMIKEAASIAVAAKKVEMTGWGSTRKWLSNFLPEHVFVLEETIELTQRDEAGNLAAVKTPTGINQQFVHTHRGSSIQYQEYVRDAVITFNVICDWPFTTKDWAMILTSGEKNGLGASRSQGYGTFGVTRWDAVDLEGKKTK
jgi:hypothetical protein